MLLKTELKPNNEHPEATGGVWALFKGTGQVGAAFLLLRYI